MNRVPKVKIFKSKNIHNHHYSLKSHGRFQPRQKKLVHQMNIYIYLYTTTFEIQRSSVEVDQRKDIVDIL